MVFLYKHTLKRQRERQGLEHLRTVLSEQDDKITRLEAKLEKLAVSHQPTALTSLAGCSVGTINSDNRTCNVSNRVTINVFGQEATAHIDRAGVKTLLDTTIAQGQPPAQSALTAILKAATLIYSDPSRPENLTCYLPNKKQEDVMVHSDSGWEVQPCPLVLPPMVQRSVDALFDNQPFEDAIKYGELMKALRENEQAYKKGKEMKTVLVRNKALLEKALGDPPK